MEVAHVLRAWKSILAGRAPSLSIEVTKECPLRCPGCYAYEPEHLGGLTVLRELTDYKGDALVAGILDVVARERPLHLSLVGGDPLVRHKEMEAVIPELLSRGIHVQLVTSAFRPLPAAWGRMENLNVVVSIDGLAEEHDVRRAPATYERILKNIEGQRITVHSTIVSQMAQRPGYLTEFAKFWDANPNVKRIWFSIFTPQRGAFPPERLTRAQRESTVAELYDITARFSKVEAPAGMLRHFLSPPQSPDECIFAQTTKTISADLKTKITPCQFGGDPDCSECGCVASMGLAAVGSHRLGLIQVKSIFDVSLAIGKRVAA